MSSKGICVVSVNMQYPFLNVNIRLEIMLVYNIFAGDVVAVLEINMFWTRKTRILNTRYSLSMLQHGLTGKRAKTETAALRAKCYRHCYCRPSGDCCECTCVDGPDYSCGLYGFNCIDPTSGCIDPFAAEYPDCIANLWNLGNGYCHTLYNNEMCGYDLGKKHYAWYTRVACRFCYSIVNPP